MPQKSFSWECLLCLGSIFLIIKDDGKACFHFFVYHSDYGVLNLTVLVCRLQWAHQVYLLSASIAFSKARPNHNCHSTRELILCGQGKSRLSQRPLLRSREVCCGRASCSESAALHRPSHMSRSSDEQRMCVARLVARAVQAGSAFPSQRALPGRARSLLGRGCTRRARRPAEAHLTHGLGKSVVRLEFRIIPRARRPAEARRRCRGEPCLRALAPAPFSYAAHPAPVKSAHLWQRVRLGDLMPRVSEAGGWLRI